MYATVQALALAFGTRELSQLLCDEQGLVSEPLLSDALNEIPLDGYTTEEQAAIQRALLRANTVLDRQSVFINGHLTGRYPLPLPLSASTSTPLQECCLALTRAALSDDGDNLSELVAEERKFWRKWLKDIETGKALLQGVNPTSLGGAEQQRLTGQASSAINWNNY